MCTTLSEMLKTYHSKAIREPCTRMQANFWYGRESSLDGSENVDEEGGDDEDEDEDDDDFGVENPKFDMTNSG